MVGADFILNVIVDSDHQIQAAFAGETTAAHRIGCEWVAKRGKIPVSQLSDIVLASAGGFPKDLNLYQAQKALDNMAYAVRSGGIIILLAECPEGLGSSTFKAWLDAAQNADDLLRRIEQEFVLGGHKAAAIGSVLAKAQVFLVSVMPPIPIEGLHVFPTLDAALDIAFAELGEDASISIFPNGGSVLPDVSGTQALAVDTDI
jgi:nickel-dependent lactate racemase